MTDGKNATVKKEHRAYDEVIIGDLLGICALVTIIITNLGVICRYIFEISMPWNEELVKAIFIWMIFVGFAMSYRNDSLAGIMFIEEWLKKNNFNISYKSLKIFQAIAAISFGIYATYESFGLIMFQIETDELTTVLELPMYVVAGGMLVGFFLFTIYAGSNFIKTVKTKVN